MTTVWRAARCRGAVGRCLCLGAALVGCVGCGGTQSATPTPSISGGAGATNLVTSAPTPCPGSPAAGTSGTSRSALPADGGDLALAAPPCWARYEGIADVRGRSAFNMTIGRVRPGVPYFAPTVLTGTGGQTVRLHIANTTPVLHNFSIPGEHIDLDVGPGATADVVIVFPAQGSIVFFCKYHADEGQAGELCTGCCASGSSC